MDSSSQRDSGKSSLIKTVFKADVFALLPHQFDLMLRDHQWSPINKFGRTAEFRPPDNSHLIVHKCSAFGPREMQAVRDFITANKNRPTSKRLHAIW